MTELAQNRAKAAVEVDQFMPSFVPGGMGGTETYARQVFEALQRRGDLSLHAYIPENAQGFTAAGEETAISGVRAESSTLGRLKNAIGVWLRSQSIRKLLRTDSIRFVPFSAPFLAPRLLSPFVVTVHDVQHKELPELFSAAEKLYRKFAYERPARRADHIITISEFAKRGIVRHLGVAESKVSVIPLGVDTEKFVPNFMEREDFVYYPARGWAHKNHPRLIAAMEIVRRTRPELRLVLTGGALDALGELPSWVENRGLVPFEEVQELFRRARVLAFPSLYEGFGFPPLEAMASATPVAASTAASIPEICGEAAIYFDPTDPVSIAEGILRAIEERDQLVPLGLARVKQFTWEDCASGHAEVFHRVAAKVSR